MKLVLGILLLILVLLQARLWTGAGSLAEIHRLEGGIAIQADENAGLEARNQELMDEVKDLKNGLDSIEERARSELGLIRKGETFYLLVEDAPVREQEAVSPVLPLEEQVPDLSPLVIAAPFENSPAVPLPNPGPDLPDDDAAAAEQSATDTTPPVNPYLELFRDGEAGLTPAQAPGQ